ncbi:MAG: response regulator [Nitrospirae bacterium YQR-1]
MDALEKLKELTVLYVEDEFITRESLGRFIKRRVREIYIAENGKTGLELFLKEHPDIVITDIEMPVMNGIEMINKIRESSLEVPIIITTAYNDDKHKSKAASSVVIKPIIQEELIEAMLLCVQSIGL